MSDLDKAAHAVASLETASAFELADDMVISFERAGEQIAGSLERAAGRGELSFKNMAEAILRDYARLAIDDLIAAPLTRLLSELTPHRERASQGALTVNLNISGVADVADFRRSEGQITASLARAASQGFQRS